MPFLKLLCIAGMLGMASAFSLNASELMTQDTTHDETFKAIENAVIQKSRVTRRLAVIIVVPGATTVQDALASASAGDELVLRDGTYPVSSTISISKDITIRAANGGQAILEGGNSRRVMYISSGTVVLEGLSITKGYASGWDLGGGMRVDGGTVTIQGSNIYSNTAGYGGGIHIGLGTVNIDNSQISSNTATYYGGGVYVLGGSGTISNSQIYSNTADYFGGGVYIACDNMRTSYDFDDDECPLVSIQGTNIYSNGASFGGGGGLAIFGGTVTIQGSSIYENTAGNNYGPNVYASSAPNVQVCSTDHSSGWVPSSGWGSTCPTLAPTPAPTLAPTPAPTLAPTLAPTPSPTLAPTATPLPCCSSRRSLLFGSPYSRSMCDSTC